jgi:hypothetical protein
LRPGLAETAGFLIGVGSQQTPYVTDKKEDFSILGAVCFHE